MDLSGKFIDTLRSELETHSPARKALLVEQLGAGAYSSYENPNGNRWAYWDPKRKATCVAEPKRNPFPSRFENIVVPTGEVAVRIKLPNDVLAFFDVVDTVSDHYATIETERFVKLMLQLAPQEEQHPFDLFFQVADKAAEKPCVLVFNPKDRFKMWYGFELPKRKTAYLGRAKHLHLYASQAVPRQKALIAQIGKDTIGGMPFRHPLTALSCGEPGDFVLYYEAGMVVQSSADIRVVTFKKGV
jgi:hypothetical protein